MPNSTHNRLELESILEDVSMECVLADVSDPDSFDALLGLLKKFFQKAKESNFSELAEDAKKAGKIVKSIIENKPSESEDLGEISDVDSQVESLNQIISEMKSFLHFITRSSQEEEQEGDELNEPSQLLKSVEQIEPVEPQAPPAPSTVADVVENQPTSETTLIHPGELPAFLNIDDFAEFLSLQRNTLEKMEVLILDIEKNNNRAYAQGELKRIFHTTKGEAGFLGLKDIEKVCHLSEDLMDRQHFGNIVDILLAVKDWLEATYKVYSGGSGRAPSTQEIIKMFDEHNNLSEPPLNLNKIGAEIEETKIIPAQKSTQTDNSQNGFATSDFQELTSSTSDLAYSASNSTATPNLITESINVDAARLDRMVNIIGELAIAESMVTQSAEITGLASSTLLRALSSLHKITRELQTLGLSLRMVPLKSLFNRMDRVVRDLAKKTGKKIQFIIKGESTELDKTLVDKLGDPLIHLVRNSVDHGVEETPKDRIDAGKPEVATLELRAFHKGGYLFIEVEDDGRGINRKRLEEKAIEKGIITAESLHHGDKMAGDEILNLVFHPGLTTAKKVTDVSGRGVGMDVVRKSIESCRGKVSISSNEGKGTICTIKIPLTLSIIDGLVVRVAREIYVIPTLSVVTSLKVDKRQISNVFQKGEMINFLGNLIPLFRLNRLFKLNSQKNINAYDGIVVVVEDSGLYTALLVDELMGKQNTVIKSLGMGNGIGIEEIKGISGGTIMPDGRVSLILDIAGIIELSHAN
ncbi:MAG: chemotaxis protein CheA [Desulfamplus sp.]|nr:chemotaxis protein CheA [Desulfamplus sp.]